ncbi:MAG: GatB/YqeY domain-containing protein [bacterium]
MTSLLDTIQDDLKTAMKSGDKARVQTLRYLISKIQYARIDKGTELEDEDVLDVLSKQAKSRKESIEAYESAGREELAEKERAEREIIESYLPEQLDEDSVREVLIEIADEEGLSGMADMGSLMKHAMERLRGKAEGRLVSSLAKEILEREPD